MAEDNPKPLIAYVANVIEEQLHELDRRRVAAKPGPTQVVGPPFFVNENKFFAPLVQVVPTEERMLSDKVTNAEIKDVLEAYAKALRHGGKPTTLGYSTDAWAAIQERAATKVPTKPPGKIESEKRQRDAVQCQRELALDLFRRLPRDRWRTETKHIAGAITVAFDRSEKQALREVTKLRNELLRSHPATAN
jgi:hypothetical protein